MSDTLDRSRAPTAGQARSSRFPAFERHRTAEGLELLLLRRSDLPLVGLQYINRGGAQFDPIDRRGLSSFTAGLLDEGTELRSSTEIADAIEKRGGFLSAGSSWDGCSASVLLLREHLAFGLELLAEIVTQPAFAEDEIERLRALRLGELERRRTDPSALAARFFARALYGDGVYGLPLIGDTESATQIQRSDVQRFWATHRPASGSSLIATGDIDPQALLPALEGALQNLGSGSATAPPVGSEGPLDETEIHVVDRPEAAQTELRIGHVGVPRNHPERAALILLNTILGGKFTSRINLNLRERNGYTYGAHSAFVDRIGRGPFVVSAAVETEATAAAAREILSELRRLREERVSQVELEEAKSYVLGVFPYTLQTLQGIHDRLEDIVLYGLPDDYFDTFPERLRAVSAEHIQVAAKSHLHPDRTAIVAVGPAAEVAPQLETLGVVQIHESA